MSSMKSIFCAFMIVIGVKESLSATCSDENSDVCTISCATDECTNENIICSSDTDCDIYCEDEDSCVNSNIYCPPSYDCDIYCSNNTNACYNTSIRCLNETENGECNYNLYIIGSNDTLITIINNDNTGVDASNMGILAAIVIVSSILVVILLLVTFGYIVERCQFLRHYKTTMVDNNNNQNKMNRVNDQSRTCTNTHTRTNTNTSVILATRANNDNCKNNSENNNNNNNNDSHQNKISVSLASPTGQTSSGHVSLFVDTSSPKSKSKSGGPSYNITKMSLKSVSVSEDFRDNYHDIGSPSNHSSTMKIKPSNKTSVSVPNGIDLNDQTQSRRKRNNTEDSRIEGTMANSKGNGNHSKHNSQKSGGLPKLSVNEYFQNYGNEGETEPLTPEKKNDEDQDDECVTRIDSNKVKTVVSANADNKFDRRQQGMSLSPLSAMSPRETDENGEKRAVVFSQDLKNFAFIENQIVMDDIVNEMQTPR